jgi:hypothetical protein
MPAGHRSIVLAVTLLLVGCASRHNASQTYLAGKPVDLHELTADEVADAVQITPRGDDVFFQAPPIQTTKIIDLHSAGAELGVSLGKVERVRFGYLFGVLDGATNTMKHYALFQSNFVTGNDRYSSVSLPDHRPLTFSVSRAPDPCVPNCFPVVEALIVSIPEQDLRANQNTGLPLTITLTNGDTITTKGSPAYVQGYLQAVDRYRS